MGRNELFLAAERRDLPRKVTHAHLWIAADVTSPNGSFTKQEEMTRLSCSTEELHMSPHGSHCSAPYNPPLVDNVKHGAESRLPRNNCDVS
ncbi:hypothetical protein RRG08_054042 [Elysia crispata]|uniref:Uncharacterized protein n=1 Tax=Elysia crispata TaxID=231223 RepID=A0AAE0Z9T9_9GAST|nr:hypothetical protein RRG08_054042 [Elysia crispata]